MCLGEKQDIQRYEFLRTLKKAGSEIALKEAVVFSMDD